MSWRLSTLFTLLLAQSAKVTVAIPLSEFFPYGPDHGDQALLPNDDSSEEFLLTHHSIHFYESSYDSVFVGTNGIASFETDFPEFLNQELPMDNAMIAAFYADIDTRPPVDGGEPGKVYFRESQDANELSRFSGYVNSEFGENSFDARALVIITWYKVGYFDRQNDKTNTFQLVIGSNPEVSFALFFYASGGIKWTRSQGKLKAQVDLPAQLGLFGLDSQTPANLASADEVERIDQLTNIDIPGVFLFKITGETMTDPRESASESGASAPLVESPQVTEATATERNAQPNPPADVEEPEELDDEDDARDEDYPTVEEETPKTTTLAPPPPPPPTTTPIPFEPPQTESPVLTEDEEDESDADYPTGEPETTTCPPEPSSCDSNCAWETDQFNCRLCVCDSYSSVQHTTREPFRPPPTEYEEPYRPTEGPQRPFEPPRQPEPERPYRPVEEPQRPFIPPIRVGPTEAPYERNGPVCTPYGPQTCHAEANCIRHEDGGCCKCNEGFYGNGKECLKSGDPQRINGLFSGRLNGISLDETDLHTYVVTSDGRAYTALAQIPPSVGRSLLLVNTIGGVMGWLFAQTDSANPNEYNGFMLTGIVHIGLPNRKIIINQCNVIGGLFNRSVTVHISDQYTVTITQEFSGKDIFHYFKGRIYIVGTLPEVPENAEVEFGEYTEEYRRSQPGLVKSYSTQRVRVNRQQEYHLTIDQTIRFEECPFGQRERRFADTMRLKVERGFVLYDEQEHIVRYASANKVESFRGEDPCRSGAHSCTGHHMTCAVDGLSYRCVCLDGFELVFNNRLESPAGTCADIDECRLRLDKCDRNADCSNTIGSYACTCRVGFAGDGLKCSSADTNRDCGSRQCDPNAECLPAPVTGLPECVCKSGFTGNGLQCGSPYQPSCSNLSCHQQAYCTTGQEGRPICVCHQGYTGNGFQCHQAIETTRRPSVASGRSCARHEDCGEMGECFYNDNFNEYQCRCRTGFTGDGTTCTRETESCNTANNCNRDASCVYEQTDSGPSYLCRCKSGFTGDGYQCTPIQRPLPGQLQCNILNNCHPNAACILDQNTSRHRCVCLTGYQGDGYACKSDEPAGTPCSSSADCHENGHCVFEESIQGNVCECLPGFRGDGVRDCEIADECNPISPEDCDSNAQCKYNDHERAYTCECNPGFVGNGRVCREQDLTVVEPTAAVPFQPPRSSCEGLANCHAYAHCVYDDRIHDHTCKCLDGYVGDGFQSCLPAEASCRDRNNCGVNAECVFDQSRQSHKCQCRTGFEGDGFRCSAARTCLDDSTMCDSNAECAPSLLDVNNYECRCKIGFHGNGKTCKPESELRGRMMVFAQGMAIMQRGLSADEWGRQVIIVPMQIAVGLAYDCVDDKVVWTDITGHAIRSANVDGTNLTKLIGENLESPEGVAVDWVSRNVYYTDSGLDHIGVASLDGKYRKVLIKDGLVNPRAIMIDIQGGKLYWSDWNRRRPQINKANLDGSDVEEFVTTDLSLPNGLVVLQSRQEVCWVDAGLQRLECIGISGAGRKVVFAPLNYPFGLTAHNDEKFFWTDWEDKRIHSVSVYGTGYTSFPASVGGAGKLYGLVAIPDQCPFGRTACSVNNGGCKYLCLPRGNSRTCVCADNVSEEQCNAVDDS